MSTDTSNEEKTVTFNVDAFKERLEDDDGNYYDTGKWIGVVIVADEPYIYTPARRTREKALDHAKRSIVGAIHCKHEHMDYKGIQRNQDHMGNDYDEHVWICGMCGFIDTLDVDDDATDNIPF